MAGILHHNKKSVQRFHHHMPVNVLDSTGEMVQESKYVEVKKTPKQKFLTKNKGITKVH